MYLAREYSKVVNSLDSGVSMVQILTVPFTNLYVLEQAL